MKDNDDSFTQDLSLKFLFLLTEGGAATVEMVWEAATARQIVMADPFLTDAKK